MENKISPCPYCSGSKFHTLGACPRVKKITYRQDGGVESIELREHPHYHTLEAVIEDRDYVDLME